MKTSYRKMFDEVQASEKLRGEVRNMTRRERKPRKHMKWLILAAALIVVLAGVVAADGNDTREPLRDDLPVIEAITLEEELGRQWEENGGILDEAQKQVIAQAVQAIYVSDTCGGVTVTVDAVYATELYLELLVKIQGKDLSDLYHGDLGTYALNGSALARPEMEITKSYCSASDLGTLEDGTLVRHLVLGISQEELSLLDGAELKLRMRNLKTFGDEEWVLPISLAPAVNREVLTVDEAAASGYAPEKSGSQRKSSLETIRLQDIRVTATGFRFRTAWGSPGTVYLCLSNGTEIKHHEMSDSGNTDGPHDVEGRWPAPADFSKIEALRVGDTVISLR